jgi:hypothetical protein
MEIFPNGATDSLPSKPIIRAVRDSRKGRFFRKPRDEKFLAYLALTRRRRAVPRRASTPLHRAALGSPIRRGTITSPSNCPSLAATRVAYRQSIVADQ